MESAAPAMKASAAVRPASALSKRWNRRRKEKTNRHKGRAEN
jgi:hypothetical protein